MAIEFTEVDGVPTLIAPSAGQTVAGLVFRVGRADEPLSRSGLTHVLEHLVLHQFGNTDHHYNGSTGPIVTSFHSAGTPEDVGVFLTKVCEGITSLPVDRLETEKGIVRTEWASRTPSVDERMNMWRYGARNFGVLSYREPGTYALTPEEMSRWRDAYFTRENAVLWIAGSGVPAGLRLNLPSGRRQPVPTATSALPVTPAYYVEGRQAVVFNAIVARTPAAPLYAEALERSLFRDLRQEAGVSYTVSADWSPRGDGYGTVTAAVDALPDKQSAALGGFIDCLAALRHGRIEESDLSTYVSRVRERSRHPDAEAGLLAGSAVDLLIGQPVRTMEERLERSATVTVADVQAVAEEAMTTALLQVPVRHSADWAGFTEAPRVSTEQLAGAAYPGRAKDLPTIHIGVDGVTSICGDDVVSVRFDNVASLTTWPDGGRQLVGNDGFVVGVEPTLTAVDAAGLARIDAAVPSWQKIFMPARASIPQPPAAPVKEKAGWRGRDIAIIVASILGTLLFCCFGAFGVIGATSDDPTMDSESHTIGWVFVGGSVLCMAVTLAPMIWLLVRRRRR